MPKVSEEYRKLRRAEILDAARRCFLVNGFHATSMQDIVSEAGLSMGAVYRYFVSKDEMIMAICDANLVAIESALRAAIAAQSSGGNIGAAIANLLEVAAERHKEQGLATIALMVWSESLRNPTLAQRLRDALTTLSSDLVEPIRQQQSEGLLADITADAVSDALIAILSGFLLNLGLGREKAVINVPAGVRILGNYPPDGVPTSMRE